MANYQSNIMVKQTGSNAGKLKPSEFGGRMRVVHGEIVPASVYAAGSVIELARLPKGARLLPLSMLHFEAGQDATMTVKVGDSADDDRYLAAVAPGANAGSTYVGDNAGDYVLPDEDVITLTTGTAALTANKKIYFHLIYVVD